MLSVRWCRGPLGLASSVYAASEGLNVLVRRRKKEGKRIVENRKLSRISPPDSGQALTVSRVSEGSEMEAKRGGGKEREEKKISARLSSPSFALDKRISI